MLDSVVPILHLMVCKESQVDECHFPNLALQLSQSLCGCSDTTLDLRKLSNFWTNELHDQVASITQRFFDLLSLFVVLTKGVLFPVVDGTWQFVFNAILSVSPTFI
jgi:hypothetical protein